jgi:phenylacetate-coenzyme A ligase PaaK-like adenylate-forming protein
VGEAGAAGGGAPGWAWPDPLQSMAQLWDMGMVPWLSPAARNARVQRRWHDLVDFARARSPYYEELYGRYRLRQTLDPQALPVVTKAGLMAQYDRVVTDPRLRGAPLQDFIADPRRVGQPFAGSFAVWTSSGTSGVPGVFVHDAQALAIYDALQVCRLFGAPVMGLPGLALGRYAMVAATGGHFAGAAMIERLRALFPAMRQQTFSLMQPLDALCRQLDDFQPDTLASYPSAALLLAHEQQAGRLHIRPRQIWTGGECLGAPERDTLAAVFRATVREEYGASEFPSIAVACRAGALHVNADWVVLEPVDADYRPVPPACPSHSVLLTNLANHALPLIRYDLGDSITVQQAPCSCGSRLPVIRVLGRTDDTLALLGVDGQAVRLLPLVLTTVLEDDAGVYDFQLAQTGAAQLRLWNAAGDLQRQPAVLAVLRAYLARQGLANVAVEPAATPPRPRAEGGKVQRIVRCFALDQGI